MPLNLSFTHIMVVLIVALIVLGPDKLPEAARTAARGIREFRRMTIDLKAEVRESFPDIVEPLSDLRRAVAGVATAAPSAMPAAAAAASGGGANASPTASPSRPDPEVAPLQEVPVLDGHQPPPGTFVVRPGDRDTIG